MDFVRKASCISFGSSTARVTTVKFSKNELMSCRDEGIVFLAVQDSSIGDIVSESLSQSDF